MNHRKHRSQPNHVTTHNARNILPRQLCKEVTRAVDYSFNRILEVTLIDCILVNMQMTMRNQFKCIILLKKLNQVIRRFFSVDTSRRLGYKRTKSSGVHVKNWETGHTAKNTCQSF